MTVSRGTSEQAFVAVQQSLRRYSLCSFCCFCGSTKVVRFQSIDLCRGSIETYKAIAISFIKNPEARVGRLGNLVQDEAILECSKYRSNPDIFYVMPKGDKIKPKKQ